MKTARIEECARLTGAGRLRVERETVSEADIVAWLAAGR